MLFHGVRKWEEGGLAAHPGDRQARKLLLELMRLLSSNVDMSLLLFKDMSTFKRQNQKP